MKDISKEELEKMIKEEAFNGMAVSEFINSHKKAFNEMTFLEFVNNYEEAFYALCRDKVLHRIEAQDEVKE